MDKTVYYSRLLGMCVYRCICFMFHCAFNFNSFSDVAPSCVCGACAMRLSIATSCKHLARVLNNFKNISKTLASRHQHYMCYQMMNPSAYRRNQITYTGGIMPFFFFFFFSKYSPFLIKSSESHHCSRFGYIC